MDPDATLAIIRDRDAELADRVEAALELNRWLFNGGHVPADFSGGQRARLNSWRVRTVELLDVL